jgi:hypothetical protein
MGLETLIMSIDTHKTLRPYSHVNFQELHKFRQRLINITQIMTRKQYPEKTNKTPIKNYKTYILSYNGQHFRR